MEQITIATNVSRETALAHGLTRFGASAWALTPEQLATLSPDAVRYVAARSIPSVTLARPLEGAEDQWAVVRDALETAGAKASAELEKAIQEALAQPDEKWIEHGSPPRISVPGSWGRDSAFRGDPRIEARILSLVGPLADAHDAWEAEAERNRAAREEREALAEARAEERRLAQETATEALVAWCQTSPLAPPALARAARDGYPIANGVLRRIAELVAEPFEGRVVVDGTSAWDVLSWETRSAPSDAAFAALDAMEAHIDTLEGLPECVSVELDTIDRVSDANSVYTAISVIISAVVGSRRVVIVPVDG